MGDSDGKGRGRGAARAWIVLAAVATGAFVATSAGVAGFAGLMGAEPTAVPIPAAGPAQQEDAGGDVLGDAEDAAKKPKKEKKPKKDKDKDGDSGDKKKPGKKPRKDRDRDRDGDRDRDRDGDRDRDRERDRDRDRDRDDRDRRGTPVRVDRVATYYLEAEGRDGDPERFQATFRQRGFHDVEVVCRSLDRSQAYMYFRADPPRGPVDVRDGDEASVWVLGDGCERRLQRVTVVGREDVRVATGGRVASVEAWVGEAPGDAEGTTDVVRWSAATGLVLDWDVPSQGVLGELVETSLRVRPLAG